MIGYDVMRMVGIWCLVVVACVSCAGDGGGGAGRVALALTGQFYPGELTSLDLFVYGNEETECQEDGSLSTEPTVSIDSYLNIDIEEGGELTFTLRPNDTYVLYARAGQRTGTGPLDMIARGCATVTIEYQAEVELSLHRINVDTCGDDTLDSQEMCDDGNNESGDGCDEDCATEVDWVNDVEGFSDDRQYQPIAAGDDGLIALCWRSDASESQQAPMAWFDELGGEGEPFKDTTGTLRRDCFDVDVLSDMVLTTYSLGTGSPTNLTNMITAWHVRDQLEPVTVGVREDQVLLAAFTGDAITTLVLNGGQLDLRMVTIDDVGLTLTPESTTYEVDTSASFKVTPALAGGPAEGFIVAWADDSDEVWARVFTTVDSGADPQALCEALRGCSSPDVAGLRNATTEPYLVVYRGSGDYIVGRFMDASGEPSDEFDISTEGDCAEPAVAPLDDDDHRFVVVWTQTVDEVDHVFARVVDDVETFGDLATGRGVSDEPFQVTPDDGSGFDQPQAATAYGTSDPSTILVFYRDIHGKRDFSDDRDSDIGFRLLRVAPNAGGS